MCVSFLLIWLIMLGVRPLRITATDAAETITALLTAAEAVRRRTKPRKRR
ncbi:hypothetical protein ABZ832_28425 [Streptantibioticus parmotrematis]